MEDRNYPDNGGETTEDAAVREPVGDAAEEAPGGGLPDEAGDREADPGEAACRKLRGELEGAADRQFAEPVIGHLLRRCGEDGGLARDVAQAHKTWEKCLDYIFERARKQTKGSRAAVRDDVVYEWAEDYYRGDDGAEKEKAGKSAAKKKEEAGGGNARACLLYTSPSPRD